MPKALALDFIPSPRPIIGTATKFGGQPAWIEAPQWPLSKSTGQPMRFIGQIALDQELFPGAADGALAYLFMTEEEDWVDGTWEPDGGENAVIVQPGGSLPGVATAAIGEGPTLFQMVEVPGAPMLEAQPCEFAVATQLLENHDFLPEASRPSDDEAFEAYILPLEGNKVGGTPAFLQGDEFPEGTGWRLLLQLDSTAVPFFVNFGDAGIGYAFLDADARAGKFLWQCA